MPDCSQWCLFSDDSKLGQKMLEKMGWKKGNALGLREDGDPEPIKVLAKSDRRGTICLLLDKMLKNAFC
jgi:G-patch domain